MRTTAPATTTHAMRACLTYLTCDNEQQKCRRQKANHTGTSCWGRSDHTRILYNSWTTTIIRRCLNRQFIASFVVIIKHCKEITLRTVAAVNRSFRCSASTPRQFVRNGTRAAVTAKATTMTAKANEHLCIRYRCHCVLTWSTMSGQWQQICRWTVIPFF